jgi:hypothetical protein
MHAASDICVLTQEIVTLIAVLTIIGAQEAEFYSGQETNIAANDTKWIRKF